MLSVRIAHTYTIEKYHSDQGVRPSDPLVGEPAEPQGHPRRTQGIPKEDLRKIPASSALGLIVIVYFVYPASISALMGQYTRLVVDGQQPFANTLGNRVKARHWHDSSFRIFDFILF